MDAVSSVVTLVDVAETTVLSIVSVSVPLTPANRPVPPRIVYVFELGTRST
jgi:hypothetical protein